MVLTILKIIGIILLVLLLLIIFILSLLLFLPIKYRFSAEYFENPDVIAFIRFAPVGLNAQVTFKNNDLLYTVKAFGGVIMTNTDARLSWLGRRLFAATDNESEDIVLNTDNNTEHKVSKNSHKGVDEPDSVSSEVNLTRKTEEYGENTHSEHDFKESVGIDAYNPVEEKTVINKMIEEEPDIKNEIKDNIDVNDKKDNNVDIDNIIEDNKEVKKNKKKIKKDKKKSQSGKEKKPKHKRTVTEKIDDKINFIKKKYADIKEKLLKLNKKKDGLIKVYKSKRFEAAKKDVKNYIKYILMVIKPKHIEGWVHVGLSDPADTGELIGVLAMILPLYDGFLDIRPDFDRQILEGRLKGDGRIRLCSIAKIIVRIIFNKNLIKVAKRVKTIVEA